MGGCNVARVCPERSSVRGIRITASRLGLQLDRLYRDRFRWELLVFRQYHRRNIEFERFPESGTWHPPASSDEASATAKTRRSKGSKLDADTGSNLNAD